MEQKSRAKAKVTVKCIVCGAKILETHTGRKKFCSSSCRQVAWKASKHAQEVKKPVPKTKQRKGAKTK